MRSFPSAELRDEMFFRSPIYTDLRQINERTCFRPFFPEYFELPENEAERVHLLKIRLNSGSYQLPKGVQISHLINTSLGIRTSRGGPNYIVTDIYVVDDNGDHYLLFLNQSIFMPSGENYYFIGCSSPRFHVIENIENIERLNEHYQSSLIDLRASSFVSTFLLYSSVLSVLFGNVDLALFSALFSSFFLFRHDSLVHSIYSYPLKFGMDEERLNRIFELYGF